MLAVVISGSSDGGKRNKGMDKNLCIASQHYV